jgi:hypothetical protein
MSDVNWIDLIQWPAMLDTLAASWFVASSRKSRRKIGFWLFLVSNVLWVVWAVPTHAHALIALQICLAIMNIRGAKRVESSDYIAPVDTQ